MEPTQTPALLGRSVDYGDLDKICTLLTRDLGKVSALAKAARRSRKRYGGALSLFVIGEATLRPARRGELWTLERFDCQEDLALGIAQDVVKVAHGSYILELARELWPPDQPEPQSFALVVEALRALSSARAASPSLLRAFELQALAAAGVGPSLGCCVQCGAEALAEPLLFSAPRGGVLCARCSGSIGVSPAAPGAEAGAERDPGSLHRGLTATARAELCALQQIPLAEAVSRSTDQATARGMREVMMLAVYNTLRKEIRSLAFIAQLAGQGASSPRDGVDSPR